MSQPSNARASKQRIAIVGRAGLGGVQMRGISTADAMGIPFIPLEKIGSAGKFDVLILVKYYTEFAEPLRAACDRLIWDPLDCFESLKPNAMHTDFWGWARQRLPFDDIIATSPACADTMRPALRDSVPVHLAPHHADPRINEGVSPWYDPRGPIVYCGGLRYIESGLPALHEAAAKLGRGLIVNKDRDAWRGMRGAALSLHLRLSPYDTPLNRYCKPQVKAENAAAAGVPILASPHPCLTTLRPGLPTWAGGMDLAEMMQIALESEAPRRAVTLEQHAKRMWEIVG